MLFRSALAAATIASVANAQKWYEIDPETVDINIREIWCTNSENSCPLICNQYEPPETLINTCDPELLTYGCLCGEGQGIKPNMSEYSLTIPYFLCTEWGNQCVTDCNGDASCATSCREDNPCGAQDPERLNETDSDSSTTTTGPPSSSTAATETETDDGTTIFTGTPGSEDEDEEESSSDNSDNSDSSTSTGDDDNGSGAASLLAMGSSYGLTVVMGGMFLGFALF
jgi:hypothetical protein